MAGNNKKSSKSSKTKSSKSGLDSAAESALAAVKAMPGDQQLAAMTAQYTELALQQTQLKTQLSTAVSRYEASERSKDQLNSDYTKAMLSKGQLESLCRELQKQNKLTKEENLARIREEEEKRRDVSARLNTTLADITGLMQQNTEKNSELRKENQNMAARLNDLVAQYEARQQNVDKILKQRDLQLQLAEAKLAKAHIEATEERETFLKDKKRMLEELQACQEKITRMSSTEIALRTQLTKYAEQYEQFQTTVQNSNAIMNKFKIEMDSMTKKIKKLEKETISWQTKWQKSNTALLDMLEERTTLLQRLEKLAKQNTKLQQLGRTLQQQLVEERRSHAAPAGVVVRSVSPTDNASVAALEITVDADQPQQLRLSGDAAQSTDATTTTTVSPRQLEVTSPTATTPSQEEVTLSAVPRQVEVTSPTATTPSQEEVTLSAVPRQLEVTSPTTTTPSQEEVTLSAVPRQLEVTSPTTTTPSLEEVTLPAVPVVLNIESSEVKSDTSNGDGDDEVELSAAEHVEVCSRLSDATSRLGNIESQLAELRTAVIEATSSPGVQSPEAVTPTLECVPSTRESTIEITEL